MPAPARDFEAIAVDPHGIAPSDKPHRRVRHGTRTGDLVALLDAFGHTRFALSGTDTGMPIAQKFRRLTMPCWRSSERRAHVRASPAR